MSKKLEIIYTATDDFANSHKPHIIYHLPLYHDTFVADCSFLPRFEE